MSTSIGTATKPKEKCREAGSGQKHGQYHIYKGFAPAGRRFLALICSNCAYAFWQPEAETPLQNHQRGSVLDKSPATQLQIAHAQTGTPCTPMQVRSCAFLGLCKKVSFLSLGSDAETV